MSDLNTRMNEFIKSDKSNQIVIVNNGMIKYGKDLTKFFDIDFTRNDLIEFIGESVNDRYQIAMKYE